MSCCSNSNIKNKQQPIQIIEVDPKPKQKIIKMLIIGDSGTGKTSLSYKITQNTFPSKPMLPSIGISTWTKHVNIENSRELIKLEITDTAGQERFGSSLPEIFFRQIDILAYMYDTNNPSSFANIKKIWQPIVEQKRKTDSYPISIFLIAHKTDLENAVDIEVSDNLAQDLNAIPIRFSSKNDSAEEFWVILKATMSATADKKFGVKIC